MFGFIPPDIAAWLAAQQLAQENAPLIITAKTPKCIGCGKYMKLDSGLHMVVGLTPSMYCHMMESCLTNMVIKVRHKTGDNWDWSVFKQNNPRPNVIMPVVEEVIDEERRDRIQSEDEGSGEVQEEEAGLRPFGTFDI